MNDKSRIEFIVSETLGIHSNVDELYEALMDGETKEALKILDIIGDRVRSLKADLSNKEE